MAKDFKSEWNAAKAYTRTLILDDWEVKETIERGDYEGAIAALTTFYDDLSAVMSEEEMKEAEELIRKAMEATKGHNATNREQYFGNHTGTGLDDIRKVRRYLLRVQRERGLLVPGRSEDEHWDPDEFMRGSDL